jgi:ribosome-binding factor A
MLPHGGQAPDPLSDRRKGRRKARLGERVREVVSEIILFKLKDPRIGFVTVIDAEVTDDVKEATVRLSVLGDESAQRTSMRALEHSRGFIQHELGTQLATRFTPVLHFKLDDRTERAATLDERFARIQRERQARDDDAAPEADAASEGNEED